MLTLSGRPIALGTPVFSLSGKPSMTETYHNLSHHGQKEKKVQQLEATDHQQMTLLRNLITNLSVKRGGGARLLDSTMILYGSNLGDANIHDNTNLPILLAGGGLRHGKHLGFIRDDNKPLCNLFVTMLQNMGVETGSFGSSAGDLKELMA